MQQPVPEAAKPATAARPPLPNVPPEFDAASILSLDAPRLIQMVADPQATIFQKAKACHRLAVIGGKDAVPPLAALLDHPELSNYARFALEPNPDPSAAAALRAALPKLSGRRLAGAITSLGVRQDPRAVDSLAVYLDHADREVAAAALAALGRIATAQAAKALHQGLTTVRAELQPIAARAALICAGQLNSPDLYKALTGPSIPKPVRLAAIRALTRA
jgi:HEAT repeat protein